MILSDLINKCFFVLQIALGQDQTEKAIVVLKNSALNGNWLCLKNLHLCISWLPSLENVNFVEHLNEQLLASCIIIILIHAGDQVS